MKVRGAFIGLLVGVLVVVVGKGISYGTTQLMNGDTTQDVQGYTILPDTFNAGCVPEAMKSGQVSREIATNYCSCVYMTGVTKYGLNEWTHQVQLFGETSTMTPDLNVIVNDCATQAYAEGV